jgi:RimJ/RimL family protein N-acetyltransferase
MDYPHAKELSENVLARRVAIPLKPARATLEGSFVRLTSLNLERDVDDLWAVSNGRAETLGERTVEAYDADALVWRYMSGGPFASAEDLARWLRLQVEAPNALCLCAFDPATGRAIGVANLMTSLPEHLKIELGNIWYSPLVQRTNVNLEATYLMLRHAFELGYRRVEWKCDALNERSRRAALQMGFTFEGIQEQHFIVKNRNRDTAWFRILDREWPSARVRFEEKLQD